MIQPWVSCRGYMEEQKPLEKGILLEEQDSFASDSTSKLNISLGSPQHAVVASSAHYACPFMSDLYLQTQSYIRSTSG